MKIILNALLIASTLLVSTVAHAGTENWVMIGQSDPRGENPAKIYVDTYSRSPMNNHTYLIIQRSDYRFPQPAPTGGLQYTSMYVLKRVSCDQRMFAAAKIIEANGDQVVYDSGAPSMQEPLHAVTLGSIGASLIDVTCGTTKD